MELWNHSRNGNNRRRNDAIVQRMLMLIQGLGLLSSMKL